MELEKAYFGLGCFWGVEARFAALDGVKKTRVGYSGGDKEDPTYHELGNHTETVEVKYNPDEITYKELVDKFWELAGSKDKKVQYRNVIFYEDQEQKQLAEHTEPGGSRADIEKFDSFHQAEDYHQKYRLRNSPLFNKFNDISDEELVDSVEAAKANARAAGKL